MTSSDLPRGGEREGRVPGRVPDGTGLSPSAAPSVAAAGAASIPSRALCIGASDFLWQVLEHRDGDVETCVVFGLKLRVQDLDEDAAWWTVSDGERLLAEGKTWCGVDAIDFIDDARAQACRAAIAHTVVNTLASGTEARRAETSGSACDGPARRATPEPPPKDAPAPEACRTADAVPREGQTPDLVDEMQTSGSNAKPAKDLLSTPDTEAEREAIVGILRDELIVRDMAGDGTWIEGFDEAARALIAAGFSRTASEIHRLREIVSELRAALAPVARLATAIDRGRAMVDRERAADDYAVAGMNDVLLTHGDLRRARALLQEAPDAEG